MPALYDVYRQYFDTIVVGEADTALREEVFRLRYQVYCVENPFEDPAAHPDGLESDAFDQRAAHCLLLHKPSQSWAGSARLILPNPEAPDHSFALQQVCKEPVIADPQRFPALQMGEVSRVCISKDFRKRQGDGLYPQSTDPDDRTDERRVIPNMILGLLEGLIRMSLDHGLVYLCAVMERPLLRLLERLGIHLANIGPLVEYHGRRQPCMLYLETMLLQARKERPDVWEVLTDDGRHWQRLQELLPERSH